MKDHRLPRDLPGPRANQCGQAGGKHLNSRELSGRPGASVEPVESQRDSAVVLLTVLTGMTDGLGFVMLGQIFTSVMTGNLVLLGLDASRNEWAPVGRIAGALLAYVLGAFIGARVAGSPNGVNASWPAPAIRALAVEWCLLMIFAVCWILLDAPTSAALGASLLAINSCALGIQGSAVLRLGVPGLSTTYLTGTLLAVVAGLATGHRIPGFRRSVLVLIAITFGAAIGGLLAGHLRRAAPLGQLTMLAIVVVVAWRNGHDVRQTDSALQVEGRLDGTSVDPAR